MTMINLERCKAISNGNIYNVVSTVEMKNGFVGNLNGLATGFKDVYNFETPATATLETENLLLIFNDETQSDPTKTISDYVIPAGTKARAYFLSEGDMVKMDKDLISGTAVKGEYLVPADGSYLLSASGSPVGKLYLEVISIDEVIGFDHKPAVRAYVKKA